MPGAPRHWLGGEGSRGRAAVPGALCQGLHGACWKLKHPWEGSKGKLSSRHCCSAWLSPSSSPP